MTAKILERWKTGPGIDKIDSPNGFDKTDYSIGSIGEGFTSDIENRNGIR